MVRATFGGALTGGRIFNGETAVMVECQGGCGALVTGSVLCVMCEFEMKRGSGLERAFKAGHLARRLGAA